MATHEVENEAGGFIDCEAQAAPNLLLKQDGALGGPKQQQGVDIRKIDTFVVEVAGENGREFPPRQHPRNPFPELPVCPSSYGHRLKTS